MITTVIVEKCIRISLRTKVVSKWCVCVWGGGGGGWGGECCTVEVDEARFGKPKFQRGRLVEGQSVVEGICQETRQVFLVPVLFSVPTSGPQLVYQRPWYVLFCLWKSAYKRSLAAYRKE